jgi:hypothetical protein
VYFGNRTIGLHLLRGLLGVMALYGSFATMNRTMWPSLILLPAAVFLLKGRMMCWTIGLIETIVTAIHKHNERKFASASGASAAGFPSNSLVP